MSVADNKKVEGKQRLFFALWPDEKVLQAVRETWQAMGIDEGKAVKPEKFHVTLLFLGDVPAARIGDLIEMAGELSLQPCELIFDRLEHWVRPAVLCLTAETVPPPLAELVEALKKGVRRLGFRPERRPFRPHLTLARKVRKRVISRPIDPLRWPVKAFTLVTSRLGDEGSHYEIIGRWPGDATEESGHRSRPGAGQS